MPGYVLEETLLLVWFKGREDHGARMPSSIVVNATATITRRVVFPVKVTDVDVTETDPGHPKYMNW